MSRRVHQEFRVIKPSIIIIVIKFFNAEGRTDESCTKETTSHISSQSSA